MLVPVKCGKEAGCLLLGVIGKTVYDTFICMLY